VGRQKKHKVHEAGAHVIHSTYKHTCLRLRQLKVKHLSSVAADNNETLNRKVRTVKNNYIIYFIYTAEQY